jgi:hypothetical protein
MDRLKTAEERMIRPLRDVFGPNFSIAAHGTSIESAEKILKEGLRAKSGNLDETAVPLLDHSKTFDEQSAGLVNDLLNWKHRNSPAVVIVVIPNPGIDEAGGLRYFNSFLRYAPKGGTDYVIPPEYVLGYVNARTKEFVKTLDLIRRSRTENQHKLRA